jgi:hypothetical protein
MLHVLLRSAHHDPGFYISRVVFYFFIGLGRVVVRVPRRGRIDPLAAARRFNLASAAPV